MTELIKWINCCPSMLQYVALFYKWKDFKGYCTFKMESNSNLPVRNQVSSYPVDLPCQGYAALCPDSEYLSSSESDPKLFRLPNGAEVKVTHDNIGQLRLFGEDEPPHSLLALHLPEDEAQVVAIYMLHKWWPISDVLKTSSKSRNGLVFVESVMERVILFLLNQIVFGMLERPLGEHVYFSRHPVSEYGKIFWQDGEAVGFYTVKKKGSLCNGCTGQCYVLPVLDTVFVRSHWRRNGLAMQMLQDFCKSMPTERVLGISYPISPSMYGVCKKYLEIHHEQRERLYEVEPPGNWSQRRNVWLTILVQHWPTNSTISDESPHVTQATDKQLTDNTGKMSMPRLAGMEPSRHQRQCVEKRPTDQTGTPQMCKKAKMS